MSLMIPNLQPQNNNTPNVLQQTKITTEDGYVFTLKVWFFDQQQNWFYSLNYTTSNGVVFEVNNERLTAGNVLINYRNQVPFGLFCVSKDGGDPSFDTDFTPANQADQFSARIQLYTLTREEMILINNQLSWLAQTSNFISVVG
jgi:hypothetical protein